mmetsp:Transcript_101787/g.180782  ORF Transcript_101787/g.180782 Transcript_101787/m.180782 type:complete len:262 (+) Transcript_101787:80-865(+)
MPAASFQVKLSGDWKDYKGNEDKILKRAYLAGFPNAKYRLRGQQYQVDFAGMTQMNVRTHKKREIRPPYKWKAPEKPIVEAGPTFCVKVPPGSPGTTIQVPHPKNRLVMIAVNVPATAKVGAAMLVPVPPVPDDADPAGASPYRKGGGAAGAATAAAAGKPAEEEKSGGWSTGAKVAAGGAVVVALGGAAVGGAILGEHVADIGGWDAAMEDLGDVAADAGEAIGDVAEDAGEAITGAAEDAGEWIAGAAEDVGDFVMDLF